MGDTSPNEHIPSGKRLQKTIENGPVEIVSFPIRHGGSFHSDVNVYQRIPSGEQT